MSNALELQWSQPMTYTALSFEERWGFCWSTNCCSERSRKQLLLLSKKELSHVKKLASKRITSSPVAHADVALIGELDEQWSFVGSKARQHGL
nr:hypothetical protein DMB79_014670 [Pectobacterium aquaticum]